MNKYSFLILELSVLIFMVIWIQLGIGVMLHAGLPLLWLLFGSGMLLLSYFNLILAPDNSYHGGHFEIHHGGK